jgi:hypothetical protein
MALEFYSGLPGSTFGQLLEIIQFLVALHTQPGQCCDSKQAIIASSQILTYSQQSPTITYKYKLDVSLTCIVVNTQKINGQLDATHWVFIAKLIVLSTCFGHHCAHYQELKNYTDGFCLWYTGLWFTGRWSGVDL